MLRAPLRSVVPALAFAAALAWPACRTARADIEVVPWIRVYIHCVTTFTYSPSSPSSSKICSVVRERWA